MTQQGQEALTSACRENGVGHPVVSSAECAKGVPKGVSARASRRSRFAARARGKAKRSKWGNSGTSRTRTSALLGAIPALHEQFSAWLSRCLCTAMTFPLRGELGCRCRRARLVVCSRRLPGAKQRPPDHRRRRGEDG